MRYLYQNSISVYPAGNPGIENIQAGVYSTPKLITANTNGLCLVSRKA